MEVGHLKTGKVDMMGLDRPEEELYLVGQQELEPFQVAIGRLCRDSLAERKVMDPAVGLEEVS